MCLDGIVLKRSWGGEVSNVSVLVAIGVNAHVPTFGFGRVQATTGSGDNVKYFSLF